MVEINEKLDARYRQQKDGVFDEDEEWRLRQVAQSNAAVKGQVPDIYSCIYRACSTFNLNSHRVAVKGLAVKGT